jgi:hypothetical protein
MRGTKSRSRGPGRTYMRGTGTGSAAGTGSSGLSLRGGHAVPTQNQNVGLGIRGEAKSPVLGNAGRGAVSSSPKKVGGFRLPPTRDGVSSS